MESFFTLCEYQGYVLNMKLIFLSVFPHCCLNKWQGYWFISDKDVMCKFQSKEGVLFFADTCCAWRVHPKKRIPKVSITYFLIFFVVHTHIMNYYLILTKHRSYTLVINTTHHDFDGFHILELNWQCDYVVVKTIRYNSPYHMSSWSRRDIILISAEYEMFYRLRLC